MSAQTRYTSDQILNASATPSRRFIIRLEAFRKADSSLLWPPSLPPTHAQSNSKLASLIRRSVVRPLHHMMSVHFWKYWSVGRPLGHSGTHSVAYEMASSGNEEGRRVECSELIFHLRR